PLREAHQGKARLGLPPVPARLPVGLLRGLVIGEETVDLSPLVASLTGRGRALSPQAALSRATRLAQRLLPGSVQLKNLSAMHEAATREGDEIGLAFAPFGQGGGPLLRAANLMGITAGEDHPAIDDSGHD